MKHTLLCLDDEVDIVEALERQFRKSYRVLKTTSGSEALKLLRKEAISLIISDQRMPEMTGVEFLQQASQIQPDAIRILLTGYTEIDSVIAAINSGQVYRYITKPWDPRDLSLTVDQAIEKFEIQQELKNKNQSLANALKDLKQLDEAKTKFMILINHELKTPLTVLTSYLELLSETSLTEEQQLAVRRMSQSRDRLHRLIEDSLLLMSVESGQRRPQMKKTDIGALITQVVQSLKLEIDSKELQCEIDFKGVKTITTDESWLQIVLAKILQNAIKFADKSSRLSIELDDVSSDQSPHQIQVSVVNDGPLISPAVIKKIKDPFTLDEKAMNHREGTGLGLAITQSLLQSLGSELTIENTKKGVRVVFNL